MNACLSTETITTSWIGSETVGIAWLYCIFDCDIKLYNLLFAAHLLTKVADFGPAKYQIESKMTSQLFMEAH